MRRGPGARLAIGLGLLALAGCAREGPPEQPAETLPVRAEIATVALAPVPVVVEAVGTVRSARVTTISSNVRAYVVEITVREGDVVQAGELLVRLDASEVAAGMAGAEAEVAAVRHARDEVAQRLAEARIGEDEARAGLVEATAGLAAARGGVEEADAAITAAESQAALARATFARYRQLFEARALSRQEYDEAAAGAETAAAEAARARARLEGARAAVGQAEGRLARAERAIEAAGKRVQALDSALDGAAARIRLAEAERARAAIHLDRTRIVAPGAGIVVEKSVEVGELAAPGRPLLVLDDPRSYRVEVDLAAGEAAQVRPGLAAEVMVDGLAGAPLAGRVAEIMPAADPAARTVRVKVQLPPVPGLRSGLYGRARIPTGTVARLLVPRSAVVEQGQLTGVFVVDPRGEARYRLVTLGGRHADHAEVLSGLEAGERVVAEGAARLRDGVRVEASR